MISPSSSLAEVLALNCLQNSMMLTCACPNAGPTGGAGVALPAAICSFTCPVTFLAMSAYLAFCPAETSNSKLCSCDLLDLAELQLHRSCAPEDRDHYLQRLAVFINFI